VQIPTTLLAQVDSSVGGKTAVNHPSGKNMIGAFYQPQAVIIDSETLQSLPPREYAAGIAEVVKYGVIADSAFMQWLERNVDALNARQADALSYVIQRSCEVKAAVVAEDEREGGVRAILNYGHTFGHAIENLSGYGAWLHGEAVAVGMVMAARFSERLNLLPQGQAERLAELLTSFHLPVSLQANTVDQQAMLAAMGMDKKAVDGKMRFVVTGGFGNAFVVDDFDPQLLQATLSEFC
jgi:3-dehydroquinate synthase